MSVVVIDAAELRELVREAVRDALADRAPEPDSDWLDAAGVAALLHVHPRTVAKLARDAGLPSHRIGRLFRFRRADVLAWIESDDARARRQRRGRR